MEREVRTEAQKAARRKTIHASIIANHRLMEVISEQCQGCDEARIRAFVLADRVGRGATTIENAAASLKCDTDECQGTSANREVYDARPGCWRKQQLGYIGIKRGYRVFPDKNEQ